MVCWGPMVQDDKKGVQYIISTQQLGEAKRYHVNTIQGPVIKNKNNFHYKDIFIPYYSRIIGRKIINDIVINHYFDTRIDDYEILKLYQKVKYEVLFACGQ